MVLKVGIDLGTTNSVVGYFENGKIEYLRFRNQESIPSVLLYQDSKVTVGDKAKRKSVMYPENFIKSSKTFMGDNNKTWNIEDRVFTPTDVATEILKEIYQTLTKKYSDVEKIEAVITVPAYFTSTQIDETKKAGENAGFEVKRIITEPVAAAIAYGFDDDINQKLFIVDIGGGTFDTSILDVKKDDFETIAIDGDAHLGGDNFDENILEFMLKHIRKEKGINLSNFEKSGLPMDEYTKAKQALVLKAEEVKKELSELDNVDIDIANLFSGYNLKTSITKDEFEEMNKRLFEEIEDIIKKTLRNSNLSTDEIDKVVLVGGTSKIPAIRKFVTNFFNKQPYSDKPLDKLVAMGATIVSNNEDSIQIRDIISHSLGIELVNKKFSIILPKNANYPIEKSDIYTTVIDYQTAIDINVYEGEDTENVDNNSFYGGFTLDNIEQALAGVPQIEVTFGFDKNRILKVTAKDLNTGSQKSEEIEIDKGSKKKITPTEQPLDICLVVDVSGSMCGTPLDKAKIACEKLVTEMIDLTIHKVGLVEFGGIAKKLAELSQNKNELTSAIKSMSCFGSTDMAGGIKTARKKVLDEATNKKVVILVTDGYPNSQWDTQQQADKLKQDTRLITIGIGDGVDSSFLQNLASSYNDYYSGANFDELSSIFEKISSSLTKK